MRRVIESEWLRGNVELSWRVGLQDRQFVRKDLGFIHPLDSEAIAAEFTFPADYNVNDTLVGQQWGDIALAGGTSAPNSRQQQLRDGWWEGWRASPAPPVAVDFGAPALTGQASTWQLLDREVWLLARRGADGPSLFPEPGPEGPYVTATHSDPRTRRDLPPHFHWRVAAVRDVVQLLPAGTGLVLGPETQQPRRFSATEVEELAAQAVAFPAGAASVWTPAEKSWLTRLGFRDVLDRLAGDEDLRGLWIAGHRVGDGDTRVVFVYEPARDDAKLDARLASVVFQAASQLRRCYRVIATGVTAVPDDARAWLADQPPVIG
jgi:hypothetical protein